MTSTRLDHRRTCVLSAWTGNEGCCHWCDEPLIDKRRRTWCSDACRRTWERNHVWRRARAYARKKSKYLCSTCGADRSANLEVNHVNPVNGSGYGDGCSHHQVNLEVLCHSCHVTVTNAQRAAGLIGKNTPKESS